VLPNKSFEEQRLQEQLNHYRELLKSQHRAEDQSRQMAQYYTEVIMNIRAQAYQRRLDIQ
jgi:hypothetical protein